MGRGEFRGAAVVAAALAVVTVLVAWRYDLPVRDPDGVSVPTWIRLPLIVLAAVALDVVLRWVRLARRDSVPAGAALRAVLRDRWDREQVWFTVSGLATWYVAYVAFRNLKSYVPFVNDRLWDAELARLDRMLWFGHDPAETLHQVLGTGWAAWVLAAVYVLWIGLVPATLAIALVWTRRSATGAWYVTAVSLNWVLGVAVYYAIPSLGPIYASPDTFATLPHTPNTDIQQWLLEDRVKVLAGPWDTNAVQTIAAFASLHVAVIVTICLVAEAMRLPVWLRVSAWTFAVLTVLATVYLGWHYFTDVLGGIAIGVLSLVLAGRLTSPRSVPQPRTARAATSPGDRDGAGPARSV